MSEVVVEEDLDEAINQLLDHLLGNSPAAVRETKALVFDVAEKAINTDPRSDDLIAMTSERIAAIRVSDEGQEGLTAFLEKRPAAWLQPAIDGQEKADV